LQFWPFRNGADWRVIEVWHGAENLHFGSATFILKRDEEAIVRFMGVLQVKILADTPSKPITVFKPPRGREGTVQTENLKHSFFREFPQYPLVSRAASYVDSSAPLNISPLSVFSSVHGLKQVIRGKFNIAFCNLCFLEYFRVGWHDSDKGRIASPVKLRWQTPIVLKINKQPSISFLILRPNDLGNGSIGSAYGHVGSLIGTRRGDAGVQRSFSLPIACVHRFLSIICNSLFLSDHTFGSLPDFVGSARHGFHFVSLFLGGFGQSVCVGRTGMDFTEGKTSDNCINDGRYRNYAREVNDQLVVDRNQSPLLAKCALFGAISCIAVGCYWLLLALCFDELKPWIAFSVLILGIVLFTLVLSIILYHKKSLTHYRLCNTVSFMANVLSAEKQTAIIAALAEGSSIRSIERITGVHRDTIMRLGVKIGQGCTKLMDSKMQDLDCNLLQFDELWGFIGKKERHCSVDDNPTLGDVWTFCAIDSETKLVPSFKVGKRTHATTTEFVQDVASRMQHRVQVSSDAMHLYVEAMELAFGSEVDYGQCVKVYAHDAAQHPERKYSAPHFASAYRRPITGNPEMELVSTSHVERLNATTRLHMRRLTRLTLAFSKKLENFEAAVALHFAYYNFVKRHNTLRCTPAMAAGVERDFWSVADLVEATA